MHATTSSLFVLLSLVTGMMDTGASAENAPAAVVSVMLDSTRPESEREATIKLNPHMWPQLVQELTRNLRPGTATEYERIPWIWRVAAACGRRNDSKQLKHLMDVALPKTGEPLRDWQAVVIGGGVVMGVSDAGQAPARRVAELLAGDEALAARWNHAVDHAVAMADNGKVPTPTRYDALRLLAAEQRGSPWDKHGPQLKRYLANGTHDELQSGAVGSAVDVDVPEAAAALVDSLRGLSASNRNAALDGLLRTESRAMALLDAIEAGKLDTKTLGPTRAEKLTKHTSEEVARRATEVIKAR